MTDLKQIRAQWLDTKELAAHLNLKPETLSQWRSRKQGPPYVTFGRSIRYRLDDVENWVSFNRRLFEKSGAA